MSLINFSVTTITFQQADRSSHVPWKIISDSSIPVSSIILVAPPTTSPPPLLGVQGLCSVVVWYGPEDLTCENRISGYAVKLCDPNLSTSNVTRHVGANRTFYILTEEDNVAGKNTHVQVSLNLIFTAQ